MNWGLQISQVKLAQFAAITGKHLASISGMNLLATQSGLDYVYEALSPSKPVIPRVMGVIRMIAQFIDHHDAR